MSFQTAKRPTARGCTWGNDVDHSCALSGHWLLTRVVVLLLLALSTASAPRSKRQSAKDSGCPLVELKAERLPNLNIPRSHHAILNVGGEVVVIGGHTDNFIPTPTAEYFKDGRWHTIPMSYTHDGGVATVLSSGKVLVAGGFEKEMGIGQSWGVELYDPASHTFRGIASLDRKRAVAVATEIDGGRVVIAGNWYSDDDIEVFDGDHTFSHAKGVSQERSTPYVLRIAKDNVVVFGSRDTKGKPIDASKADFLHGNVRYIPLLERWKPMNIDNSIDCAASFIGDESKDDFTYLLAVTSADDWWGTDSQKDSIAIALVHNGEFSLLPTVCPVPMMAERGPIAYYPFILADRNRRKAYMIGFHGTLKETPTGPVRLFVLTIDYAQKPAALTLCYTEPMEDVDICYPVLTADGNLMLAGGTWNSDNFKPSSGVWLLHLNPQADTSLAHSAARWLWWVLALLVAATLLNLYYIRARKRTTTVPLVEDAVAATPAEEETSAVDTQQPVNEAQLMMMEKVCRMMEEEQLYLNSELKVQDVAERLGTNRTYLSGCINTVKGCTFSQLVNTYRVEHAKRLLIQQPEMKIASVFLASGFANEMSFFRAFKAITGTTPKEWAACQNAEND